MTDEKRGRRREAEWYSDFWDTAPDDEDDGVSAIRLLGELLDEGVIRRSGDDLFDYGGAAALYLGTNDQHLVRRIEDAANSARGDDG